MGNPTHSARFLRKAIIEINFLSAMLVQWRVDIPGLYECIRINRTTIWEDHWKYIYRDETTITLRLCFETQGLQVNDHESRLGATKE